MIFMRIISCSHRADQLLKLNPMIKDDHIEEKVLSIVVRQLTLIDITNTSRNSLDKVFNQINMKLNVDFICNGSKIIAGPNDSSTIHVGSFNLLVHIIW